MQYLPLPQVTTREPRSTLRRPWSWKGAAAGTRPPTGTPAPSPKSRLPTCPRRARPQRSCQRNATTTTWTVSMKDTDNLLTSFKGFGIMKGFHYNRMYVFVSLSQLYLVQEPNVKRWLVYKKPCLQSMISISYKYDVDTVLAFRNTKVILI